MPQVSVYKKKVAVPGDGDVQAVVRASGGARPKSAVAGFSDEVRACTVQLGWRMARGQAGRSGRQTQLA